MSAADREPASPPEEAFSTTRVVVLGGGFAGVSTAIELGRRTRRNRSIEVHLVSDENYFVFQPLLPEVVSCGIEASHILNPIRQLCPYVRFHCATVESIDTDRKLVSLLGSDRRRVKSLRFDHLILALGLRMDLSRTPGMLEHSLPIKTMGDAFHLRNHILSKLEEADTEPDREARQKALTFVGVGGGFSGVETVAEINDMIKAVLEFYPRARATGQRVILVHSRDRILNELSDGLAQFAERKLSQRGVEAILGTRVKEATPAGVTLSDGQTINAGTVICTVGNAPHPLIGRSSLPQERGRIVADECLRVKGLEYVWALGDSALIPDVRRGGLCPPTAQYAIRQGKRCARNVLASIAGRQLRPFSFGGLGQLAVIGHHCGVAEIFGFKLAGILAWWLWRSVYFMKLPGIRCKIRVGIDWSLDLLFPPDISKLAVDRTDRLHRAHYREDDIIIKQGDIGDRFYMIEDGKVEVLEEQPGAPARRIATFSTGESFGEIALLRDSPRSATVRCLTPVDVVTLGRQDFRTLVGSYDVVRAQMERDIKERSGGGPENRIGQATDLKP